jgi:hypothetical protein
MAPSITTRPTMKLKCSVPAGACNRVPPDCGRLSGALGTAGLPASLGTWSYGANVALNSPFGFGEQFYASVIGW